MPVELRAIVSSTEYVHTQLAALRALKKGEYAFTDIFYYPIGSPYDFNAEFVRLRVYSKSQWVHKLVVLTHKQKGATDTRALTIKQLEFDTQQEALSSLPPAAFKAFTTARVGVEYEWQGLRIFVEEIEHLPPTVEIIAAAEQEVLHMFDLLGHQGVLTDSIPAYIAKVLKINSSAVVPSGTNGLLCKGL
jgi:adenylate cyclase class IV